ncbi:MAG: hypothetical protein ACFFD2_17525 [Promethearchaeota archaeon]
MISEGLIKNEINQKIYCEDIIDEDFSPDIDEIPLDFYFPVEGTGDRFRIAEVSIKGNLCYYCVATSLSDLNKEIIRKCVKHFPGLLDLKDVKIKYTNDRLVYSSIAGFITKNALNNVPNKKINDIEIPSYISIINDAELTPVIDTGNGNLKDIKIKKREILAKYEIMAIASKFAKVKNASLFELDTEIVWKVITDNGYLFFNPFNGKKIEFNETIQVI